MNHLVRRSICASIALAALAGCASPTPVAPAAPSGQRLAALSTVTDSDRALYQQLGQIDPASFDPVAEAIALKGLDPANIPAPLTQPATQYKVGDVETFWVHNNDTFEWSRIPAKLIVIGQHAYFWQDVSAEPTNAAGKTASNADWQSAADSFDHSYEVDRRIFGQESSPGIDGDVRLYVVNSDKLGKVGGYFGAPDQLPLVVNPHSNQKQIFYISNTSGGGIGSDAYNKVLAHEFQHMIQKNIDTNEDGWLNEGLSELAQEMNGFGDEQVVNAYIQNLDQSLNHWDAALQDYGQAYLFTSYLHQRLGDPFIHALVANKLNGLASIDDTLRATGQTQSADDLYADFAVALYFDNPALADGRYAFKNVKVPYPSPAMDFKSIPATVDGEVNQYGGIDALTFEGSGQGRLTFTGAAAATLLPTDPHSGQNLWWSFRADGTLSTLTRAADLSSVKTATLTYWAWYHLEKDWDYAYVMVSSDGGQTWKTLANTTSASTNPNDLNLGSGLTGRSGDQADASAWVQETVDLSAYAGQKILLRFATINDEVRNEEGFAVDDIEIPQIAFKDDVEGGDNGWQPAGFVRIHNRVPQQWRVRAAVQDQSGAISITDLPVSGSSTGLDVDFGKMKAVILFVIGLTRFTTSTAPYHVELK